MTLAVGTVKDFALGHVVNPSPGVLTPYAGHPGIDDYLRETVVGNGLEGLRALAGLKHRFTQDRFAQGLEVVLDGLQAHLFGGPRP